MSYTYIPKKTGDQITIEDVNMIGEELMKLHSIVQEFMNKENHNKMSTKLIKDIKNQEKNKEDELTITGNTNLASETGTVTIGINDINTSETKLIINGSSHFYCNPANYEDPNNEEGRHHFSDKEDQGRVRIGAAWGIPGIYSEDNQDMVIGVNGNNCVKIGNRHHFMVVNGTGPVEIKEGIKIGSEDMGIGCAPHGEDQRFAYETIQLKENHNLRIKFGDNNAPDGTYVLTCDGNAKALLGAWVDSVCSITQDYDIENNTEIGTVLTFSKEKNLKLIKTENEYEIIAGIISSHVATLSNELNYNHKNEEYRLPPFKNKQPVGLFGLVKCKVTNSNGNIYPGDILVASNTPGYAMVIDAEKKMTINNKFIVGIAMESFSKDKGMIWIQR